MLWGVAGAAVLMLLRRRQLDWGLIWAASALAAIATAGGGRGRRFPVEAEVGLWLFAVVAVLGSVRGVFPARTAWTTPIAIGTSLVGVFLAIPDTEAILLLLGVSTPTLATWWFGGAVPKLPGLLAFAIVTALTVLAGGRARPAAAVGGLGCLLVLTLLRPGAEMRLLSLGRHVVLVLIWARVVGRLDGAFAAVALGLILSVIVVAVTEMARRWLLSSGNDLVKPIDN